MFKLDYVVIDFEGFRHKSESYLIKEIPVFGPSYQEIHHTTGATVSD